MKVNGNFNGYLRLLIFLITILFAAGGLYNTIENLPKIYYTKAEGEVLSTRIDGLEKRLDKIDDQLTSLNNKLDALLLQLNKEKR